MKIDEATRYLAQYLADNMEQFVDRDYEGFIFQIDPEDLQKVIQSFYDTLP